MKKIALAALLVALATPAWAANEEMQDAEQAARTWSASIALCKQMGVAHQVCYMRDAVSELHALDMAAAFVKQCDQFKDDPTCPEVRAYIKQRWGY